MAGNSKNFLPAYQLINAVSMASNITSAVTDVRYLDNVTYQLVWTGTPTGTFSVQNSLDYAIGSNGTVLNSGTWITIPLSGLTSPAGSAGSTNIFINQIPSPFLRLVYTASGGVGNLTAYICGKAV